MILYDDETCADASITANSINPNYPATNVVDSRLTRLYRTLSNTTAQIVFDNTTATSVTAVAIAAHNFTSGATVKIQGNATDSWGSPSVDETVTYDSGIMYKTFTGGSYRYWRLQVVDGSNPDGYIEIGRVWIGTYYQAPDISPSVTAIRNTTSVKSISIGGQTYGDQRYNYSQFVTNFASVSHAQKLALETIFDSIDFTTPIFLQFDETELDLDIYYVTIDQEELRFTLLANSDYYSASVNFIQEI